MLRSLTPTELAEVLEDSADRATLQNFAEIRRVLRRRLAVEGIDHTLIWKATLMDFQDGCRELARQLRLDALRQA
ncbi:MAG TPA: hypothetical protein VI452_07080 [Marmoricola sp.]